MNTKVVHKYRFAGVPGKAIYFKFIFVCFVSSW